MKTTMQELFEFIDENNLSPVIEIEFRQHFLEKEKQQIIDAYKQSLIDEFGKFIDKFQENINNKHAEQYYNETFKQ